MAKETKPVLIADSNHERFDWLTRVLERGFGIDANPERVKSFEELLKLVRENLDDSSSGLSQWSLIFVTDDLPQSPNKVANPDIVKTYFTRLGDLDLRDKFSTVFIAGRDYKIDFGNAVRAKKEIRISSELTSDDEQKCLQALDDFGGLERVICAELRWNKNDRSLREQIRTLSDRRDLVEGETYLSELISRCLNCTELKPIEVRQLGQGKSGASVFHILVDRGATQTEEYLLKLCRADSVWKLKSEVRGHLQAAPHLTHPGYLVNLPVLQAAHHPTRSLGTTEEPNQHVVRSGPWYAVYFDFVGGDKFGSFVDLETALVASTKELNDKTSNTDFSIEKLGNANTQRISIFETLLDWLCDNWYANSKGVHLTREERQIWNSANPEDEERYVVMPPYQLTARSKAWIQSFLDGREGRLGERFFSDWATHSERVLRLVSEEKPTESQLGQLSGKMPVVLSHVHGDLNASNILLWLEKKHPFLIDFPFYQKAGHALQDFARLEVEIKLALMDRQEDSAAELKAYEYTHTQMPIWKAMEDRLLSAWDQTPENWPAGTYLENVLFCFGLIQLLRQKAQRVQQNHQCPGLPPIDFLTEYQPALLYHTVRSIGFPSLSAFKRLLAVYSAGSILKQLNSFVEAE
ncbi:MAG: hypothetical protein ACXW3C_04990 [Pyrinomonadaceae bacterium]